MKLLNENLEPVVANRLLQCMNAVNVYRTNATLNQTELHADKIFKEIGLFFHRLGRIGKRCLRILSAITGRLLITRPEHTNFVWRSQKMSWTKSSPRPQQNHAGLALSPRTRQRKLAGQSILFIGGRAALYPQYRSLIEMAGGHLVLFRKSAPDTMNNNLLTWLHRVNQVICPADCIRHEDFFIARAYCQRTGKPCIMLERSDMKTFAHAVDILCTDESLTTDNTDEDQIAA